MRDAALDHLVRRHAGRAVRPRKTGCRCAARSAWRSGAGAWSCPRRSARSRPPTRRARRCRLTSKSAWKRARSPARHVIDAQHSPALPARRCPDRPRSPSDRAQPRPACPCAMTSPWSSTTQRSTTRISTPMMCSTQTMVMPRFLRIVDRRSAACSISEWSRPPSDSSASSSFGCVASARASSSFFRPAAPRPSTRRRAVRPGRGTPRASPRRWPRRRWFCP